MTDYHANNTNYTDCPNITLDGYINGLEFMSAQMLAWEIENNTIVECSITFAQDIAALYRMYEHTPPDWVLVIAGALPEALPEARELALEELHKAVGEEL